MSSSSDRSRSPVALAALLVWGYATAEAVAQVPICLRDVTPQTGITFRHTDGSSGRRYIVETVSAGLASFDYDGDGRIDIYFPNGTPLLGTRADQPSPAALVRNSGDWSFVDVTRRAGLGQLCYGLGVTVGDYDNDGFPDLYLSNFGPNLLYRNNGDGTFTDVTEQAGVSCRQHKVGAGVCFLDMDGDGDLDLYCANYVKFTYANQVTTVVDGFPQYTGPKDYEPDPDVLYRNNGDGTFTDVSAESGIAAHVGTGMGVVGVDYDNDGHADLMVLNDVRGNFLFHNDGTGKFEEIGLTAGVMFNGDGRELGSMGVDCADFDNDGWLDLYQTSYSAELPVLYRNTGQGFYEDVTRPSGAGRGTFPYVKWGVGFIDFDNDGHRDLFVAQGHLQDNVELYDDTTAYRVRNVLLRNTGAGKFVNLSDQAGDGLRPVHSARGAVFDDLDNDGRVDVAILNSREPPTVLRNESPGENHWLQLQLRGRKANRDGVGSHVQVVAGDLTQGDEVHSGRGYQSHFGSRLQFGFGARQHVDRIEIRWIGGGVDVIQHVAVDQRLTIIEGGLVVKN